MYYMSMCFVQGRVLVKPLTKALNLNGGYILSPETEDLKVGNFIFADQYLLGILENVFHEVAMYVPAAWFRHIVE